MKDIYGDTINIDDIVFDGSFKLVKNINNDDIHTCYYTDEIHNIKRIIKDIDIYDNDNNPNIVRYNIFNFMTFKNFDTVTLIDDCVIIDRNKLDNDIHNITNDDVENIIHEITCLKKTKKNQIKDFVKTHEKFYIIKAINNKWYLYLGKYKEHHIYFPISDIERPRIGFYNIHYPKSKKQIIDVYYDYELINNLLKYIKETLISREHMLGIFRHELLDALDGC